MGNSVINTIDKTEIKTVSKVGRKISVRGKGQRAERSFIAELQPVVNRMYAKWGLECPKLERNLMQSISGGFDIVGLDWIAFEIKHQEILKVSQWWEQTKRQAGQSRIPVLAYKQNNVKWRIVMFGTLPAGSKKIRCPVDIALKTFLVYFEAQLEHFLSLPIVK